MGTDSKIYYGKDTIQNSNSVINVESDQLLLSNFESGTFTNLTLKKNFIHLNIKSNVGVYFMDNSVYWQAGFYRNIGDNKTNGLFLTENGTEGRVTLLKHDDDQYLIFEEDRFVIFNKGLILNHDCVDQQILLGNEDSNLSLKKDRIETSLGNSSITVKENQIQINSPEVLISKFERVKVEFEQIVNDGLVQTVSPGTWVRIQNSAQGVGSFSPKFLEDDMASFWNPQTSCFNFSSLSLNTQISLQLRFVVTALTNDQSAKVRLHFVPEGTIVTKRLPRLDEGADQDYNLNENFHFVLNTTAKKSSNVYVELLFSATTEIISKEFLVQAISHEDI